MPTKLVEPRLSIVCYAISLAIHLVGFGVAACFLSWDRFESPTFSLQRGSGGGGSAASGMRGPRQSEGTLSTAPRPAEVVRVWIAPPKVSRDPKRPTPLNFRPTVAAVAAQVQHIVKLSETILAETLQRAAPPPQPPHVELPPQPRPHAPGPMVTLSAASRVSRTVAPEELVVRLADVAARRRPRQVTSRTRPLRRLRRRVPRQTNGRWTVA